MSPTQPPRPNLTPIEEWDVELVELVLPSGRTVLAQQVDPIALFTSAQEDGEEVPDVLKTMVAGMLSGQRSETNIDEGNISQVMSSVNLFAKAALVYPKLWNKPHREGEYIPFSAISFNDRAYLFAWVLGGEFQAAEMFPETKRARVQPVRQGQAVRGKAQRGNRTKTK